MKKGKLIRNVKNTGNEMYFYFGNCSSMVPGTGKQMASITITPLEYLN